MRILFLNQYFPPDPAPTGILLRELADALAVDGHTIEFVAARQDYRQGQRKGGRLLREFKALVAMLLDGLIKPRVDLVISASSPPCLALAATLIAIRHRARSIHWIMDLYPEIAVALGEVPAGMAVSALKRVMGYSYRCCSAVVALDEDMASRLREYGIRTQIIRPWVFKTVLDSLSGSSLHAAPFSHSPGWTWIYSGNLGRAHEWETLLEAQALLEQANAGVRLLFQGGGPSWPAAQERARELGLKYCDWKPYVPENELNDSLLRCQCCVVTQLPATQGLLWPSKLGFVLTLPRPLLWIGPRDGAVARELRKFAHAGVFEPGEARKVADWLQLMRKPDRSAADEHSYDASSQRHASIESWRVLIKSAVAR